MNETDSVIPDHSDGDFDADQWMRVIASLRTVEPMLARKAREKRLRLLASARWPELRLQRRSLWKVRELRISMVPRAAAHQELSPRWLFTFVEYPRYPWLPLGASGSNQLAEIGDVELRAGGWLEQLLPAAWARFAAD